MIGYGVTDGVTFAGDGIKRSASAPIAQVTNELIRIGKNPQGTCHGDSGGPLLMDTGSGEALIGVVSFGDSNTCVGNSYFERLDTQMAWVDEQIKEADPRARPSTVAPPGNGAGPSTSDAAPATTEPTDATARPDLRFRSVRRRRARPANGRGPAALIKAVRRRRLPGEDEPSSADASGSRPEIGGGCAFAPADAHTQAVCGSPARSSQPHASAADAAGADWPACVARVCSPWRSSSGAGRAAAALTPAPPPATRPRPRPTFTPCFRPPTGLWTPRSAPPPPPRAAAPARCRQSTIAASTPRRPAACSSARAPTRMATGSVSAPARASARPVPWRRRATGIRAAPWGAVPGTRAARAPSASAGPSSWARP